MIRIALKLAVVALVANATWQLFGAYWPHYKFRDGVRYVVQYRGELSDEALREKILGLAAQYDIPLSADNLSVTHENAHTMVTLSYTRPVNLAPGVTRPWPFTIQLDTFTTAPPGLR